MFWRRDSDDLETALGQFSNLFNKVRAYTGEQIVGTQSKRGFSICIFLKDGTPDGLRIVEKTNWTGLGLVFSRSQFPDIKTRDEFAKTGVYVLSGPSVAASQPTVYIGEGDPAKPRLENHLANKDFWTSAVVFTSKDKRLNKAHVQYLESRLVAIAKETKRCQLDNSNVPQAPSLSEADQAEMDGFLDEMLLIFPILGISAFDKPPAMPSEGHLFLGSKNIHATGYESTQGFVVVAGSQAVGDTDVTPSCPVYCKEQRATLVQQGILSFDGNGLKFTQDYTFDSPSTAASVLLGNSTNGRNAWKDAGGRTLKEMQEDTVQRQ
jgi:hypothetical protein